MRALWKGALSFGLINIPIRLYNATREHALNFDLLHKKDLTPIRYARICKSDGKEVPYNEIVRGYRYQQGDYVILTDEDFKRANVRKTKTIDILDFTDEDQIDTIYYEKPYFLEPNKGAAKAYALLHTALTKSKKVAIAKFVLHNREHIGILKTHGPAIVLNQLRYDSEIIKPKELTIPEEHASTKEVTMALKLIDQLTTHFKPSQYHDTYREELEEIIAEKAKGHKPRPKGKEPKITEVHDIMALLRESLEGHQKKSA
jgi:DNA end-binding protein Ku